LSAQSLLDEHHAERTPGLVNPCTRIYLKGTRANILTGSNLYTQVMV